MQGKTLYPYVCACPRAGEEFELIYRTPALQALRRMAATEGVPLGPVQERWEGNQWIAEVPPQLQPQPRRARLSCTYLVRLKLTGAVLSAFSIEHEAQVWAERWCGCRPHFPLDCLQLVRTYYGYDGDRVERPIDWNTSERD